ncbi:hypothetical protein D3C79_987020 [compost metagenome]
MRLISDRKVLIAISATTKAVTKPTANIGRSPIVRKCRLLYRSRPLAPIIIGTAKIKENSEAA